MDVVIEVLLHKQVYLEYEFYINGKFSYFRL